MNILNVVAVDLKELLSQESVLHVLTVFIYTEVIKVANVLSVFVDSAQKMLLE